MELLGSTVICINLFERVEKRTEHTYMRAGYGGWTCSILVTLFLHAWLLLT